MKKITTLLIVTLLSLATLTGCGKKSYIRDLEFKVKERDKTITLLQMELKMVDEQKIEALAQRDSFEIELYEANETIESLEAELAKMKEAQKEPQKKESQENEPTKTFVTYVIDNTQASNYVSYVFYPDPDGKTYYSDVQWYSNPLCIQGSEIRTDIIIISPVIANNEFNNGFSYYTCMSLNGIVYSKDYPYLYEN